jgi:hypothetical protein
MREGIGMETRVRIDTIAVAALDECLTVRGNTYPIRDQLKAAGFTFVGSLRQWEVRDPGPEHLVALAAAGVAMMRDSYENLADPSLWTGPIFRPDADLLQTGSGVLEVR